MSQHPTPEKIAKLLEHAAAYRKASEDEIKATADRDAAHVRLKNAVERGVTARKMIIADLEGMDCRAPGNNGWEFRVTAMLADLVAAARYAGRDDAIPFPKIPPGV